MAKTDKEKESDRQPRSEKVYYASGEVVRIRPVPPSRIDDLIELQRSLLTAFFYCNGWQGELLRTSNEQVWGDLRKLSRLIPLVGPVGSYLDIDKIDDAAEICRVFFTATETTDPDTGSLLPVEGESYAPSLVATLNGINFWEPLHQGRTQAVSRMKAEQALKLSQEEDEISEESLPAEDPALTPSPT